MTYSSQVLADAPLAYWRLGESSGTTMTDSSGHGRNGTYHGAFTLGTTGLVRGDTNTAVTLSAGYGEVAYASWMNATSITVEAIVKPTAGVQDYAILDRLGATSGDQTYFFYTYQGTNLHFDFYTTGGGAVHSLTATMSMGVAHHVAATHDNTSGVANLYIDGTLVDTLSVASPPKALYHANTSVPIRVGLGTGSVDPYVGVIDEVAVYGTALSSTRIGVHATNSVIAVGGGSASLTLGATFSHASVSGSGSLALSGSGTGAISGSGPTSGSASLSLGATWTPASASAALAFGASWGGPVGASALLSLSAVWAVPADILDASGAGALSEDPSSTTALDDPEFRMAVLDTQIRRAPSSITVTVDGGRPEVPIQFFMDLTGGGQDLVYIATLNTEGHLEPTSLTVTEDLGGQRGTRTLTGVQIGSDGVTTVMSSVFYEVLLTPQPSLLAIGQDTDPIAIPGALNAAGVYHFVFQDLLGVMDGGIGSYVFPINPRTMSSPHLELALKTHHTTSQDGQYHVFQAGQIPLEWTLAGVADTQEFVDALESYRALNRRIWIIDHRNRAWKSVIVNVDIVPRLRTNWNGELTDWLTDFTVTAVIVDQNWSTPE